MKGKKSASISFIFLTILIDVIGLGIIIPVLPSLIEELQGTGLSEASRIGGWLVFSYAIVQFFSAPLLGTLSDRFGRKPILLLALLGLGLDYILHAYAPSLVWLFIGRILAGMCGASYTVATAYIADVSKPEEKAQNFGVIGAAFGLGFIVGPVIGGLSGEYDVRLPFFIAAGLALLNALYGLIILPESLPKEKRRKGDLKKANPLGSFHLLKRSSLVIGLAFSFFLLYLASHSVQTTWAFYGMFKFDWSESMVGYSLALVGIVVALVQGVFIKHTMKWWGEYKNIMIGFTCWIIGLVAFAFANQTWLLLISVLPYCFGGIATPALHGRVSNEYNDNEQGELQGALTSLISLTSIIGPVFMTNVFHQFTKEDAIVVFPGAPYLIGAFLVIISLFVTSYSLKNARLKQETETNIDKQ